MRGVPYIIDWSQSEPQLISSWVICGSTNNFLLFSCWQNDHVGTTFFDSFCAQKHSIVLRASRGGSSGRRRNIFVARSIFTSGSSHVVPRKSEENVAWILIHSIVPRQTCSWIWVRPYSFQRNPFKFGQSSLPSHQPATFSRGTYTIYYQ